MAAKAIILNIRIQHHVMHFCNKMKSNEIECYTMQFDELHRNSELVHQQCSCSGVHLAWCKSQSMRSDGLAPKMDNNSQELNKNFNQTCKASSFFNTLLWKKKNSCASYLICVLYICHFVEFHLYFLSSKTSKLFRSFCSSIFRRRPI